MAAVNADDHGSLGSQYGVQGFPTIKIFGANKNSPEDYNGMLYTIKSLSVSYKVCKVEFVCLFRFLEGWEGGGGRE